MEGGAFCKNVENGRGCFFVKVDLSSAQGALCTVSVFFILHFTNLGVRTHPTHPLPTACSVRDRSTIRDAILTCNQKLMHDSAQSTTRTGASPGQNMWGGRTWRARAYNGRGLEADRPPLPCVKTRRICINFSSDLYQKWGGHVHRVDATAHATNN